MILQLEVTFTAGHFYGDEWPPAPARLFQALVATSHQGAYGLIHQPKRDEAAPLVGAAAAAHHPRPRSRSPA